MGSSYNKVVILGNLGRDVDMRAIPSGDMVASFSVATTERSKNGDVTTWFRVSAFGKLAETCNQFLRKGSYVYIEGPLTQREYTDRDGNTRQSLDVRAREMRMLDKRGEGSGDDGDRLGASDPSGRPSSTFTSNNTDDDIPF